MSGTDDTCVLRARGLRKQYGREGGLVRAVDGVDLDVAAGQTLAVMGPSGCGKSTLLHLLCGLDRPTVGELFFADRRVDQLSERTLAQLRRADCRDREKEARRSDSPGNAEEYASRAEVIASLWSDIISDDPDFYATPRPRQPGSRDHLV
jgi:energy-coupling factor transporter ATP-binding protein EcfA2